MTVQQTHLAQATTQHIAVDATLAQALNAALVKSALRSSFKLACRLPVPLTAARRGLELGSRLFIPRAGVAFQPVTLGGVAAEILYPKGQSPSATTGQVVLHLHGGAFFAGSSRSHRAMGSEFVARSGAVVYMLDYRRAPEHVYPAALDDARKAYQALLAMGYRPDQIVLGGDSGGCALILALCIALRDEGVSLPAGMVMISPYVDLTLTAPSVGANRTQDPMIAMLALARGGDSYRGNIPATDPRVSPLFASLQGLPPMLIQVGSTEILLDDATRLAARAQSAGVAAECQIYDGMWHNFQMFNLLIKAADQALDEIAAFIRRL